jgi:hypothetical protein
METIFDNIFINYSEYSYFKGLTPSERIQYFLEIYEGASKSPVLDLSPIFDMISNELHDSDSNTSPDKDSVDVIMDSENIMLESNSLKAIKHTTYMFVESGYILTRDRNMEKLFKHGKRTRYLRVFNIIDQCSTICPN